MPPTPFHPTHTTPFKSSLSSSQQPRTVQQSDVDFSSLSSTEWPVAVDARHLDARHWTYLAEGGKNLLLRYVGPDTAPFVNKDGRRMALRMVKTSRVQSAHDLSASGHEIDSVDWQNTILVPDLQDVGDSSLLPPLLRVGGSQDDLKAFLRLIASKIEALRPLERRKVAGIDEETTRDVFITEDLSAPIPNKPCLIFEIKPKCGFLPNAETLSSDGAAFKSTVSRFRLHQILRSKEPITVDAFHQLYDPLHLYSGDQSRIQTAAVALYSAYQAGKGNNLRIFLDGQKVERRNEEASASAQSLAQSLWPDEKLDLQSSISRLLSTDKVQSVLARLASLQQRFDPIDVESVDAMCKGERGKGLQELGDESEVSLDEYQRVTSKLRERAANGSASAAPFDDAREAIIALLLATSYKDCSLFIRVNASDAASEPEVSVHLVDLDPKPTHKLPNLIALDQEIATTFAQWASANGFQAGTLAAPLR